MILVDVAVCELLPAQLTFVRFVFAVNDLVSGHLVQALERAIADLAGIRPLLCSVAGDTDSGQQRLRTQGISSGYTHLSV